MRERGRDRKKNHREKRERGNLSNGIDLNRDEGEGSRKNHRGHSRTSLWESEKLSLSIEEIV